MFFVDGLCSSLVLQYCTFQQHFGPGPLAHWPSTRFNLGLPDVQSKNKKHIIIKNDNIVYAVFIFHKVKSFLNMKDPLSFIIFL